MDVKFYMPGEEGASLEQLPYGMVEKIARQTTSLDQVKIWTKINNSAIKGLTVIQIKKYLFVVIIYLTNA